MVQSFKIRKANTEDAKQLGLLGPMLYSESYGHMWDNTDAYARQLMTFGEEAMSRAIDRRDGQTWLVEAGSSMFGFLSVVLNSPDPIEGRADGAEVPRIYLSAPTRRRGLAKKMLVRAERFAAAAGANHLWLDVMKEASWAWQAYHRWGFTFIGETVFPGDIKEDFRKMLVMRRPIRILADPVGASVGCPSITNPVT